MPPVKSLLGRAVPIADKTNLGVVEREAHAVVREDAIVSLHCSDGHLCGHSEPSGPHPSIAGEEPHQIQGSLVRTAKWTTYFQIRVVYAVTLTAEVEGES